MFGYVIPDKPNMFIKDYFAFRAFYCGLCKAIGKRYGCLMRFTTNYDSTILNILVHNLLNKPVEYKKQRCILHPFRKREMVVIDEISLSVADINVLLTYHKLRDNILDNDGKLKNKTAKIFVNKHYKKAKKRHFEADKIIAEEYAKLNELERNNCKNIDEISDCFAKLLERLGVYLTNKSSFESNAVFYCIGKWVYLIDALDDTDDDFKKGRYNPWIASLGNFTDSKTFIENNKEFVNILLKNTIEILKENYDKLPMPIEEGVLTNTFYYGLEMQTNKVIRRDKKCQKTRL